MFCTLNSPLSVKKILERINSRLESKGLSQVVRTAAEKLSSDFEVTASDTTKKALQEQRVVLISNHPSFSDPLLLVGAISPRCDFYLVAVPSILSVFPVIDKHFITVFKTYNVPRMRRFYWNFPFLRKNHRIPEYTLEEAHLYNVESISKATEKVDAGALVAIFPTGCQKYSREFYPGVGHLIKNLKYPEETNVVMAYISGTSKFWDYFRLFPIPKWFFPKYKIVLSEPLCASGFAGESGRAISKSLQQVYYRWALDFQPLPRLQTLALYLRSVILFLFYRGL